MAFLSNYGLMNSSKPTPVGLLEIDMDASANRIVILDRDSLENLYADGFNSTLKVVVPIDYATIDGLLVMILDDDGQYNAAALDGVRASIANLSEI